MLVTVACRAMGRNEGCVVYFDGFETLFTHMIKFLYSLNICCCQSNRVVSL